MALFWNKNKHDISPDIKELKTLITNYWGANSSIKLNSKVTVPEGYWLVLGKKGKVADKFEAGEHFLNFSTMPYMCRRFKIDKIEDGKQKRDITCNCYFVSQDLRAGKFRTYRKVEMGTKAYGIYKMHVYGMYSYKVSNVQELMQSLLNEYDYIKTGEAEDIIEAWVDEVVVATLEKNNFVITDVVQNNPIIAKTLKGAVSKLFASAGLELCELKIYKYKLPKKYQEESDNIIAEQTKELEKEQSQQFDDSPVAITVDQQQENGAGLEQNKLPNNNGVETNIKTNSFQSLQQDNNEQFKNVEQCQGSETTSGAQPKAGQNYDYVPFGNFKIQEGSLMGTEQQEKPKQKTFVDLNLDNLYKNQNKNVKRCLNCGAENNKSADHCLLCGEKFLNEEDY